MKASVSKTGKTRAILLGAVVTLSLVASSRAQAISVAGTSGKPQFSDMSCFLVGNVRVRFDRNCGVLSAPWQIPLPANPGSHTVSVSGTDNDPSFGMSCNLCTLTETPGNPVCTLMSFPANATTVQTATVSVPTNGQMYLQCAFPGGSGINTVNYNQ